MVNPTLREVARLAEVHVGTASRALDPQRSGMVKPSTRLRVEEAARSLGYQINSAARGLRTGQSETIGVVIADFGNPFISPILRGIEDVVGAEGFQTLVSETRDRPENLGHALKQFVQRRAGAIIVSSVRAGNEPDVRNHSERGKAPIVFAVRDLVGLDVPTVTHDDYLGGQLAAQHLLDFGHRMIAEIAGPADISAYAARSQGFRSIVEKTPGLTNLSRSSLSPVESSEEAGYQLAQQLLTLHTKPTAIFAHNDLMAVGALDAIREHGLDCPKDISIVGYNDSPLTDHLSPPLTTVRLQGFDLGRRAGFLALNAVRNPVSPAPKSRLEPELVVRKSTKRINA